MVNVACLRLLWGNLALIVEFEGLIEPEIGTRIFRFTQYLTNLVADSRHETMQEEATHNRRTEGDRIGCGSSSRWLCNPRNKKWASEISYFWTRDDGICDLYLRVPYPLQAGPEIGQISSTLRA